MGMGMIMRRVCVRVVMDIALHRMAAGAVMVAILGRRLADAVPMRVMVVVGACELMDMPHTRGWGDLRG